MAMESRPNGPWVGLTTESAPLNLSPGALLHADDVVIRDRSVLAQRPGLRCYASNGVLTATTQKSYYPVAINHNKQILNSQVSETILATVVNPTTGMHYFARELNNPLSPGGKDFSTSRSNYWGYPVMTPTTGSNDLDQGGMSMGDPRVVSNIYSTHLTPGQLLEASKVIQNVDLQTGVVGDSYEIFSSPLGVPEVPYLTVSAKTTAKAPGAFWAYNDTIDSEVASVAYRATMRRGVNIGAPSARAFIKAPYLSTPGTVTVNSNVAVVNQPGHTFQVGDQFEIMGVASGYDAWKGLHTVTVATTNTYSFSITNANIATATSVITKYRRPMAVDVKVHRPKEQSWSGAYTESMFGYTPEQMVDRVGDKNTRSYFQDDSTIELYRTKITYQSKVISHTDPGESMMLVSTCNASGKGDLSPNWTEDKSNLTLSLTDTVADIDLGNFLYTNPDQEGIQNSNYMPPMAKMHDEYRGYHFWANVKESNTLSIKLTSALDGNFAIQYTPESSPKGKGDVLTYVFRAGSVANPSTLTFTNATTLTGDKEETQARELVAMINSRPDLPFKARYTSGFRDASGQMEISTLGYHSGSLSIIGMELNDKIKSSDKAVFKTISKDKVYPSGTATLLPSPNWVIEKPSVNKPNRIYWSKYQIPGATPLFNYIDFRNTVEIVSIRSTSDGLYVITDSGIWMLTGDNGEWIQTPKDLSARCWAQGSVQTIQDQLILLTDQGVQIFGDGSVMSQNINSMVLQARNQVKRVSLFSDMGKESEPWITSTIDSFNNEYLLIVPKDSTTNHVLRFNLETQTWTVANRNVTCAQFSTKDDINRMLYADQDINQMLVERQETDRYKFCDEDFDLTFDDLEGENLMDNGNWRYYGYLTGNPDMNAVITTQDLIVVAHKNASGRVLYLEPIEILNYKPIERNGQDMWVITLPKRLAPPSALRELSLVRTFYPKIGLVTFAGQDPTTVKKFTRVHTNLLGDVRELTLEIQTDDRRNTGDVVINSVNPQDGWGNNPWGKLWGDETGSAQPTLDTLVPLGFNTGRLLTVNVVNKGFNQELVLQSLMLNYDAISRKGR